MNTEKNNAPSVTETPDHVLIDRPITGLRHPEALIDGPEPQTIQADPESLHVPIQHAELVVNPRAQSEPWQEPPDEKQEHAQDQSKDEKKPDPDKAKGGLPEKQPKPATDTSKK